MVLLVADMKELKANPDKQSKGVVIEARLDKSRGPIASVLVQRGTLDIGNTVIIGSSIGRIRQMTNYKGQKLKKQVLLHQLKFSDYQQYQKQAIFSMK